MTDVGRRRRRRVPLLVGFRRRRVAVAVQHPLPLDLRPAGRARCLSRACPCSRPRRASPGGAPADMRLGLPAGAVVRQRAAANPLGRQPCLLRTCGRAPHTLSTRLPVHGKARARRQSRLTVMSTDNVWCVHADGTGTAVVLDDNLASAVVLGVPEHHGLRHRGRLSGRWRKVEATFAVRGRTPCRGAPQGRRA